jgi:hypothetical protein
MLKNFFRKLFQTKKDFIITEVTHSYGLHLTSTMYTAVDAISGEVVCRYVYGAKLSEEHLKIALDRGTYPGKKYT